MAANRAGSRRSTVTGPDARTVASLGIPSSTPDSPKESPGPSEPSATSAPFSSRIARAWPAGKHVEAVGAVALADDVIALLALDLHEGLDHQLTHGVREPVKQRLPLEYLFALEISRAARAGRRSAPGTSAQLVAREAPAAG